MSPYRWDDVVVRFRRNRVIIDACGYLVLENRGRDTSILAACDRRADTFGERIVSIWVTLGVLRRRTMPNA
jgi:hypothetical protein